MNPLEVCCPTCYAGPHRPCVRMHRGRPQAMATPHAARLVAAQAK